MIHYAARMTPHRKRRALETARYILQRVTTDRELTAEETRGVVAAARTLALVVTDDDGLAKAEAR